MEWIAFCQFRGKFSQSHDVIGDTWLLVLVDIDETLGKTWIVRLDVIRPNLK
ncbi:hypothetical protein [Bartonella sp. CL45QHWL]|uniref:hypothetical protein n=1 Tax=Bartonella sp. CL45QHWL TaxID=3243533 RepID=UPI0035D0558E